MRKVKAICIYKDNKIYNLTALLKDTSVPLIHHTLEDTPQHHNTFEDLYKYVLEVLHNNNMVCDHYEEFNRVWYDISFIDINNPTEVSRYSVGGVKNA